MHNALILHYEPVPGKTFPADELQTQLALIRKLKMPVVSLDELVENDKKRKRWHRHVLLISCTYTFLAQNPIVFQHLKASGFPVTVFAPDIGSEQETLWQEIIAAGFSVGLHSVSELPLHKIPEMDWRQNLSETKQKLETETGRPVKYLLSPAGNLSKNMRLSAREIGFEAILTHKIGYNQFNADLFRLKTWPVPPHTSLKAFEHMLCRDKKELLVQEMKAKALKNRRVLKPKSLFGKLKGLFRRVKV